MNIRRKIILSGTLMFVLPVVLISIITIIFLAIFVLSYSAQGHINIIELLSPTALVQTVADVVQKNPKSMQCVYLWLVVCLAASVGVISANTVILTKSIFTPIRELTKSVDSMKRGEFNIDIIQSSDPDINKLCIAFDEMRIKIKESREIEKLHLEDRKMLLANLSHDLKTPITSIKGYIQGIRDGVADTPEKTAKYLDTIYIKANIIEEMVNNMSLFAKLETDRLNFDFEIGDLNELLSQLAGEYSLDLANSDMKVDIQLSECPAPVKLDSQKLRRVFSNLIDNAIKYKKEGEGNILISSEVRGEGVFVKVSDSGIGIPKGDLDYVFDGFYRCNPARNLNIKGNGLGLGIAKQIVEKHSGKMWVKSEENEGTTIFVYLPLRNKAQGENE